MHNSVKTLFFPPELLPAIVNFASERSVDIEQLDFFFFNFFKLAKSFFKWSQWCSNSSDVLDIMQIIQLL